MTNVWAMGHGPWDDSRPRPTPHGPWPTSGFSLAELIVAAAILGAAGVLLVGGFMAGNRSAELRREQVIATHLLASQLALVGFDAVEPSEPSGGTFEPPLEAWRWSTAWAPSTSEALQEVTLTLESPHGARQLVTWRPVAPPEP